MTAFAEEVEKVASLGSRALGFLRRPATAPISRSEMLQTGRALGAKRYVPFTGAHRKWDAVKKTYRVGEANRKAGARARLSSATRALSSPDPRVRAKARSEVAAARGELQGRVGNLLARMRKSRAPKPSPLKSKAKLLAGGAAVGAGGLIGAQAYAANQSSDPYGKYR